jgi:hypothetical protein
LLRQDIHVTCPMLVGWLRMESHFPEHLPAPHTAAPPERRL